MLTKDTAICIKAVDYSETSQVVTLFTKAAGKVSAIAKGSKRPRSSFEGAIEIFSHGPVIFTETTEEKLSTLTEFQQHPGFESLATNLFNMNCALFAAELINLLTHDCDPHPDLYDHFHTLLTNIAASKDCRETITLLILFQLSLLREIGLQPILNKCVNCKSPIASAQCNNYFSSSANGLICRDCEINFPDKIRLSPQTANCLTDLRSIADASQQTLNEIEKVLIYHFTELLHRPPKMAKYILTP